MRVTRYLIASSLIVASVCVSGCLSIGFENTSTGDLDFGRRFDKATKEILAASKVIEQKALKSGRAPLDHRTSHFVQRHFAQADQIVTNHLLKVKAALAKASIFDEYANKREKLLTFTLELQPSLDVVESDVPEATAFPTGKILFARALAEACEPKSEGFDSILLGVLIHELMHVRDGHALEQWATADGRKAWSTDKALGALSKVTALIPVLSVKHDKHYPLSFRSAKQLPVLSEFAADMGAVRLLEEAGFDANRYIDFLTEMSTNAGKSGKTERSRLLGMRVNALRCFSSDQFDREIEAIVVGSEKTEDSYSMIFNLSAPLKAAALLDSPDALALEYPGTPELSHVERRKMVLSVVQRSMFVVSAIRHSFPGVSVRDGVLIVPSFDMTMFTQHL